MKKLAIASGLILTALVVVVALRDPVFGYGRTITNPAANSALSSAVMRAELQALEDEITSIFTVTSTRFSTSTLGVFSGGASTTILSVGNGSATTTLLGNATSTFGAGIAGTYLNLTGSTASSTFANGIILSGGCVKVGTSCLTSNAGTVTSIATTYPLQGGTITTSGTLSLAFGTTTANTWNSLQNFSAGASTTILSVGNGSATTTILGQATSTFAAGISATNLFATGQASSTSLTVSGIRSALVLASSIGAMSAYAGGSCSANQFLTAITATGGCTSAAVTDSFFSGALGIAHGGLGAAFTDPNADQLMFWDDSAGAITGIGTLSGASISGTTLTINAGIANGGTATTTGGNIKGVEYFDGISLTNSSNFTFSTTTPANLLTVTNASTTNFTAGTSLGAPNGATVTLANTGYLAFNTSAASSSLQYYDGTAQRGLYDVTPLTFDFINYPTNGTGTTSVPYNVGPRGVTLVSGGCFTSGAGTAKVQAGKGSASTTMLSAALGSSVVPTTISANNTFEAWQRIVFDFGTFSSSGTTTVTCSYGQRYTY